MLPHYHLMIGLFVGNILDVQDDIFVFLILGCILPDLDIIYGLYHNVNHRNLPTHYPFVWVFFTIIFFFISDPIYWICFGGVVHLFTDIIDWELFIFRPFTDSSWALISLDSDLILGQKSIKEFIVGYYSVPWIIVVEISTYLLYVVFMIVH